MKYLEEYRYWCTSEYFDKETREELLCIQNNSEEIKERFYKELEFGTGGLRGIIGAGINRMNIYTVRKATQGLANYINRAGGMKRGVAIAFDSRKMSKEFAEESALCLNANGIKTFIFESLRPTPELSFALRTLKCVSGIVITASHNPPEYNGYKVYWEDGAQITSPVDKEIIEEVKAIKDFSAVKTMDRKEAEKSCLYQIIGEKIDDAYIEAIKKNILNTDVVEQWGNKLKIVYTPLHGTGNLPVRRILGEIGFGNVFVVPEQEQPDGSFPTVNSPNPEDPEAFKIALQYAEKVKADIVLATDPDADRLGVYVRNCNNEYIPFTGNMSGALICEYILSQYKEKQMIPDNGAIVSTIVTSDMVKAIARYYKVHLVETLTGFKYIGEQIKLFEKENTYKYIFGLEESYGCLVGTHARDKDAVAAVAALCEAAAFYQSKNKTLWDQMLCMYQKYGYYKEVLRTKTLKGVDGARKIEAMMKQLRNVPLKEVAGHQVVRVRDYKSGEIADFAKVKKTVTNLPRSNVLYFELDNNAWFCIRPSGTEPKIKYYIGVKGATLAEAEEQINEIEEAL